MITRETDNLYHDMLNSGEMYDSVDEQFIAYQHALVQRLNEFNRTDETPDNLARDLIRNSYEIVKAKYTKKK